MRTIEIRDGAAEFRITLTGRFAGPAVQEVRRMWIEKLAECLPAQFTIDISDISDYDAAGRKLLREMHLHGIHFAASTPASLVLLSEISSPKRLSVTMMPEQSGDRTVAKPRPAAASDSPDSGRMPKTYFAGK
jgi:hypothetical protein